VATETDPRVERTRAAIRDALVAVAEEEGLPGLTHQRVAERAGVGRATIYRHFPGTEDLVHEALDCMDRSLPTPDEDTFESQLVALGRKFAKDVNDPATCALLLGMMERAQRDPDSRDRQRAMCADMLRQVRAVAGDDVPDVELVVSQVLGSLLFKALVLGQHVDDALIESVVRRAV
jgi:AcrR family transcriptional regulator